MKKITFLLVAVFMASLGFSQSVSSLGANYATPINAKLNKKNDIKFFTGSAAIQQQLNSRAPGDIIYSYDFNGTVPANWDTVDNLAHGYEFIWSDIGPIGAYTGYPNWNDPLPALASTTGANGFLMFPADNYNTNQATGTINTNYVDHDAYIQSDALDFTGYSNITLQFQERFRLCCTGAYGTTADLYVEVSNDGSTWTQYPVASQFAALNDPSCTSDTVNMVEINISDVAANQSTVYVRFHIFGLSHYYWMFDDLNFIDGPTNDIIVTTLYDYFYSSGNGRYGMVPLLQSKYQPIFFRGEITNNGSNPGINVHMDVNVTRDGNAYYSSVSDNLSSFAFLADSALKAGYDGTNLTDPLLANDLGIYTETFEVSDDSTDEVPSNNSVTRTFQVTDRIYARDGGVYTGYVGPGVWADGGNDGDAIGISFDINNDSTTQIAENTVQSLSFYVDAKTFDGSTISPTVKGLIKFYDSGTGTFSDVIETEVYDVLQSDTDTWVTLPFITDGYTENLAAGWYLCYVVVTGYNGGDFYVGEDGATFQEALATFWTITGGTSPMADGAFSNYAKSPMIRVNFFPYPVTGVQSNNVNQNIAVYPNPANNQLHVDNVEGGTISVYNLVGEKVMEVTNANKFNTLNTADLAAGTYIVKVVNDNQVKTTKINIVK